MHQAIVWCLIFKSNSCVRANLQFWIYRSSWDNSLSDSNCTWLAHVYLDCHALKYPGCIFRIFQVWSYPDNLRSEARAALFCFWALRRAFWNYKLPLAWSQQQLPHGSNDRLILHVDVVLLPQVLLGSSKTPRDWMCAVCRGVSPAGQSKHLHKRGNVVIYRYANVLLGDSDTLLEKCNSVSISEYWPHFSWKRSGGTIPQEDHMLTLFTEAWWGMACFGCNVLLHCQPSRIVSFYSLWLADWTEFGRCCSHTEISAPCCRSKLPRPKGCHWWLAPVWGACRSLQDRLSTELWQL